MIINGANLSMLYKGFKTSFQKGLDEAPSQWSVVATRVTSTTREEEYGWLGKFPQLREWIGDRVIQNMKAHSYSIKNKTFEGTVSVDRDDIEDDNIGLYAPLFEEMGRSTKAFDDQLVWGLLKQGWTGKCYDGQAFFDAEHPVLNEAGKEVSVANTDGGNGTPWFLIDDTRALKPLILQERKKFQFVAKDEAKDENVFMRKEYVYGVDGRRNVGFGFWQFAWGSRQELTPESYALARKSLMEMKGDYGRPLGLRPTKLIVPPGLEGKSLKILNNDLAAGGETNEWKGTAQAVVVPWLA
ncbi:phage major head subunit gpT-like protein [Chelatococcus caeni]|uniref:Phage major head subunit gpT-like protein n=1 Tax=Chelatococcus caeni TaxID=1348468 RepID=A0A840C799_9HYPH|nr:Mu-like prophage major head subunit gpT family protein [Chelatococcus caeni]MBB4018227.1 phage major head subunit gpT-like protein [Chelatococcus caeni]